MTSRRMSDCQRVECMVIDADTVRHGGSDFRRVVVSIPKVCHGDHGPEPRFPGDVWTMYYVCGVCEEPVSPGDAFCKHCGARHDWGRCQ